MSEAEKTTQFLKWAKVKVNHSFAFEAKICKTPSLPFESVKEHQANALFRVKHGYFNYKIPDSGFDQKPYDGFQMVMQPAWVVVFWHQKRGDKRLTLIDIDLWMEEIQNSPRKSLTYERSCEIGKCDSL